MSTTSLAQGGLVAVVTGGNKGIGYSIVKALYEKLNPPTPTGAANKEKAVIYLTARSEERGNAAVGLLNKEGVHPSFHQLDIESKDSVKRFARFLKTTHGGLDILVNNAGIAYFTNPTVPQEVQARHILGINYFGTMNVCNELFPLLKANSRVVNVSSGLGHLSKINGMEPAASTLRNRLSSEDLTVPELDELVNNYIRTVSGGTHQKEGWSNSPYAVSKVAVTALTRIQQRELDLNRPSDKIVVNAVHPGWVRSDMTGGKGLYNTDEGAEAPVYAALLPADDHCSNSCDVINIPRGQFIWRDKTVIDWVDRNSILGKKHT